MKLLVLGIDGGDKEIIDVMDMPFLQSLLKERVGVNVQEDLWSRGWSEISCGLPGTTTGAFYDRPKLDGTYNFSQSYTLEDYKKIPGCKMLWEALNERGQKVGFVNLPTTLPAPEVNGFFISGAGSGFSPASRVPSAACYPPDIEYELLKNDYIWEQRFSVSGITDIDYFVERCVRAVKGRTNIFVQLSKQYKIDFGFIMQKELVILTNILFYQFKQIIDNKSAAQNHFQKRIKEFLRILDDNIKIVCNELIPDNIMIVSDHGAKPYEYSLNINAFLKNYKFLHGEFIIKNTSLSSKIIKKIERKIKLLNDPNYFNPNEDRWIELSINYSKSLAFSSRYIRGIYINDNRFGNVITNENDKIEKIEKIIKAFNSSPESKVRRMRANIYRDLYKNSPNQSYLPDIWIDLPENIFPEQSGNFIQPNPYWRNILNLGYLNRDLAAGTKGRSALCYVEKDFLGAINPQEKTDLTVVYKLILNHFK